MKTIRGLILLFAIMVAFATVQATAQEQVQAPAMPRPRHELQKQPAADAVQDTATVPTGGKLLQHVHTPPGVYGFPVSGTWASPFASATPITCSQKCTLEMTVTVSHEGVPANNIFGVAVVVANSKGNSVTVRPFNAVGLYASTVDQGGGTASASFTFNTAALPAGTYYVNGEFGLVSATSGQPGVAASPSQGIAIDAYTLVK